MAALLPGGGPDPRWGRYWNHRQDQIVKSINEGQWDYFFELGPIPNQYEPEDFELPGSMKHYFPDWSVWDESGRDHSHVFVEAKGLPPNKIGKDDLEKPLMAALLTPVILLMGESLPLCRYSNRIVGHPLLMPDGWGSYRVHVASFWPGGWEDHGEHPAGELMMAERRSGLDLGRLDSKDSLMHDLIKINRAYRTAGSFVDFHRLGPAQDQDEAPWGWQH